MIIDRSDIFLNSTFDCVVASKRRGAPRAATQNRISGFSPKIDGATVSEVQNTSSAPLVISQRPISPPLYVQHWARSDGLWMPCSHLCGLPPPLRPVLILQ